MRSLYFLHLVLFFGHKNDCTAKKMCVRKFHTIQNGSFFQRIELPSPIRCIEGCIDNIEHCKAALFIFDKNKSRGFCQLYATNSNSSDIKITLDATLNPMSTVFEVLDKCPATNGLTSSSDNLLEKVNPELKEKLELWSDPELSPSLTSQDEIKQNSKNEESVSGVSGDGNLQDGEKLEKAEGFDEIAHDEYHKWASYANERQRTSEEISGKSNYGSESTARVPTSDGLTSFARDAFSPSSTPFLRPTDTVTVNKLSPYANHRLPFLPQTFTVNNNYLPKQDGYASSSSGTNRFQGYPRSAPIDFSLPTNGVSLPAPIQPVSVTHGRGAVPYGGRCRGSNCYAPSLAYLQQRDYNQPCPAYVRDPCAKSDPCVARPQTCPPASAPYDRMPTTSFSYGGASRGYADELPSSGAEHVKGPHQLEGSPYGPLQPASAPAEPAEWMVASWSEWSPQTPCSVTCGIGISKRKRFCSTEGQCPGESTKEESCNNGPCPEWTTWSAWTDCSRSCGGGEQSRSRVCSVSQRCDGPSRSIQTCNVEKCAQWSTWGNWESCSVTCGIGRQKRRRCAGEPVEEKPCEQALCPSWTTWEPWSECSVSCGQGQRHRVRVCDGGNSCYGDAEEREACATKACSEWTDWSPWTQCTETCGTKGTRLRTRTCLRDNLISTLCDGAAQDQMACRGLPECPNWTSWGSWSSCSATCGHGQESRQRSCLPVRTKCAGPDQEFRFCQESVCPYWDEWSEWSGCTVTCGIGTCERRRKCVKGDVANVASKEGFLLEGDKDDFTKDVIPAKRVTQDIIPLQRNDDDRSNIVDPYFTPHKNNVPKSDVLSVSQSNAVIRSAGGNDGCTGEAVDRKQCDAGPCCVLSEWTAWSACSVSCGGGTRQRHRMCTLQGGLQSYELSGFPNPSEAIREQIAVEPAVQPGFGPLSAGYEERPNSDRRDILTPISAGLRPIVPVKGLGELGRIRRQALNVYNVEPFEQDNAVPAPDEPICHCDGELHQEDNCAQLPCSQPRTASICGWSRWSEWCGCTGPCNQGTRTRTRYCDNGIPANDDTLVGSYSLTSSKKCQCFGSTTDKGPCIPAECSMQQGSQAPITGQNFSPRTYPTRPDFRILSQHDSNLVRSVNRDSYVGCTWSSWSMWTTCMGGTKTRTRSCIGISLAKIRCHCDGNLVEQVPCSSVSRMEMIRPNSSADTTTRLASPAAATTWRGTTVSSERMTTITSYRTSSSAASCSWSQWGAWSTCSVTCGTGETVRKRSCPCRSCGPGVIVEVHSCELMTCSAAGKNYRKNPFD